MQISVNSLPMLWLRGLFLPSTSKLPFTATIMSKNMLALIPINFFFIYKYKHIGLHFRKGTVNIRSCSVKGKRHRIH